jgi:hypothetical protein
MQELYSEPNISSVFRKRISDAGETHLEDLQRHEDLEDGSVRFSIP